VRSLSTTFRRSMMRPETGTAAVLLLTISHASLAVPIRVCDAGTAITSRGETFLAMPFNITFPRSSDEAPPTVKLDICAVDRSIIAAVRSLSGERAKIALELIHSPDPDTVEIGPLEFELLDVAYDALIVSGQIGYEDLLNESFPKDIFGPTTTPGIF
jgi:hypothetical protein